MKRSNLASALQVFELSPEYKKLYEGVGGPAYMVAYVYDGETIPLAQIARRSNKTFWWYVTSPTIACRHTAGQELTLEQAQRTLLDYLEEEITRMFNLKKPVFEHDLPTVTFRKSDQKVCLKLDSDDQSFINGMDWMLRTMGFPRRPVWAKYLVQNRDKSFYWFENEPYADLKTGKWQQKEDGQFLNVTLDESTSVQWDWTKQVKRVK